MSVETQTGVVRAMARYKMTVVFDVLEEVEMKYLHVEVIHNEYDTRKGTENNRPHINRLYDDVIERIEASPKHPITYNIMSFEKLKDV